MHRRTDGGQHARLKVPQNCVSSTLREFLRHFTSFLKKNWLEGKILLPVTRYFCVLKLISSSNQISVDPNFTQIHLYTNETNNNIQYKMMKYSNWIQSENGMQICAKFYTNKHISIHLKFTLNYKRDAQHSLINCQNI